MAYDEGLAQRVRELLGPGKGFAEKKMFGGVGFLLNGNMACGILKKDLIVRVGPERYEQLLKRPGTGVFDITGRTMKGWIMVAPEGYGTDENLAEWVRHGAAFALSLPPK